MRAYSALKHYPSSLDLYRIAQESGDFLEADVFQKEMERYRK
jgi:hypothetical protein